MALAPGQSRQVLLHLDARAFAYWDAGWVVPAGTYRLFAGTSSRDLPLSVPLRVSRPGTAP